MVTVSNGNCSSTATAAVIVYPSPNVSTVGTTISFGSSATITAGAAGGTAPYTYLWNTGDATPTITVAPGSTTIYCVALTDAGGCTDTACATITVRYDCGEVFYPNAFSPNGDTKNDYFRPRSTCFTSIHLIMYDRWGVKVFETDDLYSPGWDGMYNGKLAESAVYNYYFSYELVNGENGFTKGTVSLLH